MMRGIIKVGEGRWRFFLGIIASLFTESRVWEPNQYCVWHFNWWSPGALVKREAVFSALDWVNMCHMCNSVTTPINEAETTSQLKKRFGFCFDWTVWCVAAAAFLFSLFWPDRKAGRVLHSIGSFNKERIGWGGSRKRRHTSARALSADCFGLIWAKQIEE